MQGGCGMVRNAHPEQGPACRSPASRVGHRSDQPLIEMLRRSQKFHSPRVSKEIRNWAMVFVKSAFVTETAKRFN